MSRPTMPHATTRLTAQSWPQLTRDVQAWLAAQVHRETGRWQATRVRLDVPPHLAEAPVAECAPLVAWLKAQGLGLLVLGSRRADAFLQVW